MNAVYRKHMWASGNQVKKELTSNAILTLNVYWKQSKEYSERSQWSCSSRFACGFLAKLFNYVKNRECFLGGTSLSTESWSKKSINSGAKLPGQGEICEIESFYWKFLHCHCFGFLLQTNFAKKTLFRPRIS